MDGLETGTELRAETSKRVLAEGTTVAVRNNFDGAWSSGFAVAEVVVAATGGLLGYHVRRTSDPDWVLPSLVPAEAVMPVRVVVDAWSVRSVPLEP
jgi:hypothetical protein